MSKLETVMVRNLVALMQNILEPPALV